MSAENPNLFSRRLSAVRLAFGVATGRKNLSRADFAGLLGLETPAYTRYERGETEPAIKVLAAIRRLTGITLDYLVADEDTGVTPSDINIECTATFAERLCWVRKLADLNVTKAAKEMKVSRDTYQKWEAGREPMPDAKLAEFADRFKIAMTFLQQGLPKELPPDVLARLRRDHPTAWRRPDALDPVREPEEVAETASKP
jgi:transcriptional regulator with XRE-family HTH domain